MRDSVDTKRPLDDSERDALASMFESDWSSLHRFVEGLTGCSATADDIVSTAFETAARRISGGKEVTTPLLFTIARRRVIDSRRRQNTVDRYVRSVGETPEVCCIAMVDQQIVARSILDGLCDRDRRALVYRYVFDLTVDEVAAQLESSSKAAESLLGRARTRAAAVAA